MSPVRRLWNSVKTRLPASWQQRYGVARWWAGRATRGIGAGISPVSYVGRYTLGRYRLRIRGVDVRSSDRRIAWGLCKDIFENREYDVPGLVVQPGWKVVDVGGNVGLFAMLAASRGAQVTSYEPHPALFEHLRANTARWGVECRRAAVVGTPVDSVELYVHPDRDIRNSVLAQDVEDGSALTEAIEVPAAAVSEVLAEECDLLKIDIEGGEFDVLAGGGPALRRAKRVIAEIHPFAGDPAEAVRLLEQAGFEVELHDSIHRGAYPSMTGIRRA
jgi:FkbM family methyltransferase